MKRAHGNWGHRSALKIEDSATGHTNAFRSSNVWDALQTNLGFRLEWCLARACAGNDCRRRRDRSRQPSVQPGVSNRRPPRASSVFPLIVGKRILVRSVGAHHEDFPVRLRLVVEQRGLVFES